MKGKIASSLSLGVALTLGGPAALAQSTAQIQAEVLKALSNSKYESVHGSVQDNGLVVLNGRSMFLISRRGSTIKFIGSRASRRSRTISRSQVRQSQIKN